MTRPLSDLYGAFVAFDSSKLSVKAVGDNSPAWCFAAAEASRRSAVDLAVGNALRVASDYACPYCVFGDESSYPHCLDYRLCKPLAQLRLALEGE